MATASKKKAAQAPKKRKPPTLTPEQRAQRAATIRATTARRKAAGLKPTGRPPKLKDDEATLKTLRGIAKIQCTTKEAAAVLGVDEVTFFAFLKRSKKAKDAWEEGKAYGLASARRKMWIKAFEGQGSVTMMIWLSKQYLGMTDKIEEKIEQDTTVSYTDDAAADFDRRMANLVERIGSSSGPRVTH
jgi:hypothetical protein